ncbi:Uncharacterised protein [uncultured archaeon]|nr:Uncharacterised protein [uncultured archaeon]
MVKIKLYGIGNEENFNYYIFDKKQEVAKRIAQVMKKVFNAKWNFSKEIENEKGEWIEERINVEKKFDFHEKIANTPPNKNKFRIDIFYGDKKMFITINCHEDKRLELNKELLKIAEMPKPKKK